MATVLNIKFSILQVNFMKINKFQNMKYSVKASMNMTWFSSEYLCTLPVNVAQTCKAAPILAKQEHNLRRAILKA